MLQTHSTINFIGVKHERRIILGLILLWLVLQGYWFWQHGVRAMGDSNGYIIYARNIADSFYFADNYQLKYLGYPLFMAAILKLGLGLDGVIIIQILLSGLATIALYRTTKLLAHDNLAPVVATFIFICWYDLQMFNGFILTESIYFSLLILAFYFILRAGNLKATLLILPLLLYIATIRPNGFIALVAYSGYLFFYAFTTTKSKMYRLLLVLLFIVVPVIAILVVDQYLLTSFTIVETYRKGQLIFLYDDLIIQPDKPIIMPPAEASPLMKLVLFIQYNTSYFFKMAGMRFLLFWGNVKPFFSLSHNLLIAAVLYPLYFFTARVLLSARVPLPLRMYILLLLGQQAFITTMTSEDWNGRFLMSVIAFVFIFGAIGLSWQIRKYWPKPAIK